MTTKSRRLLEQGLWIFGLVLIAGSASEWIVAQTAQKQVSFGGAAKPGAALLAPPATPRFGRLTCAAIGLSVPITDDYDTAALLHGVGHVPGSAFAGGLGNMVLAGHRDTFFRALRHIKPGMELQVGSSSGTFLYKVDRTEIVAPSAVRVTEIGEQPEMTLITCYPFDFIGAAPMRFIVHAHLNSDPK